METIRSRAYKNQEVLLDGKRFDRCMFDNVTFMYNGTAKYSFGEPSTITGNIQFKSDSEIVHGAIYVFQLLQQAFPNSGLKIEHRDDQGRMLKARCRPQ